MAKFTHTVMKHSLAKALMDAGMEHFDVGGMAAPVAAPQGPGPATSASGDAGFFGDLFGQNKYEANSAPLAQTDYGNLINTAANNATAGYGNSQNIQAQQQQLADALLAQSQGKGPNIAQDTLNQATGTNVANQAALMASSRGSSANPALIAREAAMQGANTQQQAAGQAATMRAQQQIAAQTGLAQQQAAMQSGNISEQGINAGLLNTGAAAQNAQNKENIANYAMVQGINSANSHSNTSGMSDTIGNILSGGAGAGAAAASGKGGAGMLAALAYKGGKIPDHLAKMATIYHPNFATEAKDFRAGGPVPGHAQVAGNSPKNDTVPAMLSPGEEVLPRTITQSSDAPKKAAEFVRHLQEKKKGKESGDGLREAMHAKKGSMKKRPASAEKRAA